jgi:hypothetical protein
MAAKITAGGSTGALVLRMKRGAISKKRVLQPRPFLGPALDQVIANGLADRVRAAITSGLKFQRGKK